MLHSLGYCDAGLHRALGLPPVSSAAATFSFSKAVHADYATISPSYYNNASFACRLANNAKGTAAYII